MRFFQSVTNLEELKKEYRKLAKVHHPDQGGNEKTFIQLKEEYEQKATTLNKGKKVDSCYMAIIDELVNIEHIEIEILGTWVWVTGETYPIRKKLAELEMKFTKKKQAWYWHEGPYKKKGKKTYSLDEIREMHERQVIKKKSSKQYLAKG